jgi:Ca2+-binding RTX toxin-like protein
MKTAFLESIFSPFGRFPRMTADRVRAFRGPAMSESLEARRLLSYSFSGGVLTFTGTSSADTIVAYRTSGGAGDYVYVRREADPNPDEIAGPYSSSSVTSVVVDGQGGNDLIYAECNEWIAEISGSFNYGNANFIKPLDIRGNTGNDTLMGGDGADVIQGETDDDEIWGMGGDDVLHGGYAGDDVSDSGGDDTLRGGSGDDYMYGGPGDDRFYSDDGTSWNDHLDGGPGTDTAVLHDTNEFYTSVESIL